MRNLALTLLVTCLISPSTFADCPSADTVKQALEAVIDFENIATHLGDILKNPDIVRDDPGISVLPSVLPKVAANPLVLMEDKAHGTFCKYKIGALEVVSFYLKEK